MRIALQPKAVIQFKRVPAASQSQCEVRFPKWKRGCNWPGVQVREERAKVRAAERAVSERSGNIRQRLLRPWAATAALAAGLSPSAAAFFPSSATCVNKPRDLRIS